eukprot:Sspe_Gene.119455::Locus_115370_Transcript_1_1_Confidence_1.000_Length_775::g.119455::m.119455
MRHTGMMSLAWLLLLLRSVPPSRGEACDAGWSDDSKGSCYKLLAPMTWEDGKKACVAEGAELASFASQSRLEIAFKRMCLRDEVWIGLYETAGGTWEWLDSSPQWQGWGHSFPVSGECVYSELTTRTLRTKPCQTFLRPVCRKHLASHFPGWIEFEDGNLYATSGAPVEWVRGSDECSKFHPVAVPASLPTPAHVAFLEKYWGVSCIHEEIWVGLACSSITNPRTSCGGRWGSDDYKWVDGTPYRSG